eukprot:gene2648-5199_t
MIASIGILIVGSLLVADFSYGAAYGNGVVGAGSIAIITAVGSSLSCFPLYYAVKRHNRAVLLMNIAGDATIFLIMLSTGFSLYSTSIPIFDKALQVDCLKTYPISHTEADCSAYYNADRTAGMRLVWASYFSTLSENYAIMNQIQGSAVCCGFGPPFRCLNDSRPFPSEFVQKNVLPRMLNQRLECGHHQSNNPKLDFYVQQPNCLNYFDQTVFPPIIGGCKYDLGIGACILNEPDSYVKGCASALEDFMQNKLTVPSLMLAGSGVVNVICVVICLMLYWKRKYDDVFPSYEQELRENKYKNVNIKAIKHQFIVRPKNDILVSRGFITPAEMHARQAAISASEKSSENLSSSVSSGNVSETGTQQNVQSKSMKSTRKEGSVVGLGSVKNRWSPFRGKRSSKQPPTASCPYSRPHYSHSTFKLPLEYREGVVFPATECLPIIINTIIIHNISVLPLHFTYYQLAAMSNSSYSYFSLSPWCYHYWFFRPFAGYVLLAVSVYLRCSWNRPLHESFDCARCVFCPLWVSTGANTRLMYVKVVSCLTGKQSRSSLVVSVTVQMFGNFVIVMNSSDGVKELLFCTYCESGLSAVSDFWGDGLHCIDSEDLNQLLFEVLSAQLGWK